MTERLTSLLITIGLLFTLTACSLFSGSDEEEEELVELKVVLSASGNINPSVESAGNPVVVNLYQLKNIDAFKSAQVLDLFEKDAAILAENLVKRQVLDTVLPSEKKIHPIEFVQGTKYLAVFVQFSNYSQAKTKAWVEIGELDDIEQVVITIDSLSVNMEAVVEDSFWPW